MSTKVPAQGEAYLGPITDTSRWKNFRHRPDDIFICTPPKNGTTWTQAICAMLIFGAADHGKRITSTSPWIDAAFAPIDDYLHEVDAQPHRRFIKTHTPFDGIPYHSSCTYLVIFRDPRDVYFSALNHRDNMADQELALSAFPHGSNAFQDWLQRVREPGTWDVISLDSLAHFFKSYWPYRELENVHLHHYSDLQRDLKGAIASIASELDIPVTPEQLEQFAEAASFDNMKRKADQYAPESGTGHFKSETAFFATGASHQWRDRLSEDDLTAFDARLAELLTPAEARWLLNGTG